MRRRRCKEQASKWVGPDLGRDQQPEGFPTVATAPGPPNLAGTRREQTGADGSRAGVPCCTGQLMEEGAGVVIKVGVGIDGPET